MPLDDLLAQLATIERLKVDRTGSGGVDRTGPATVVAEAVPCLVRPMSANLLYGPSRRDEARGELVAARIYFAGDPLAPATALSTRHRITVDGVAWLVVGASDQNSMNRLLHVDCERIR